MKIVGDHLATALVVVAPMKHGSISFSNLSTRTRKPGSWDLDGPAVSLGKLQQVRNILYIFYVAHLRNTRRILIS